MKILTRWTLGIVLLTLLVASCKNDLLEMNQNSNRTDPASTNPNLIVSTVLTESAKSFVVLGYQDLAGTMQYTQKMGGWWSQCLRMGR